MKQIRFLIAALFLFALTNTDAYAGVNLLKLEDGQRVTGEITIKGGRKVPLPEGEWIVAGHADYPGSKGKYPWTQVIFAQVQGKVITRVVRISSGESTKNKGYKSYKACTGKYTLMEKMVKNEKKGDQNCLVVRPWCTRERSKNASDFYRQALRDLAVKEGLYQPAALVGWLVRLADKKNSLVYWAGINSDLLVKPDTNKGLWIWDDWKSDAVDKSRPKQVAVELIKSWADEWHNTLAARW